MRNCKRTQCRGMRAGVLALAALLLAGCGTGKYEKIGTLEQDTVEIAAGAEGTSAEGLSDAGAEGQSVSGGQSGAGVQAEVSALELELTTEPSSAAEAAPVLEPRDETVYATGDELNVRLEPSTSAGVAGVLHTGDPLQRTGYSQQWSQVVYQGQPCYVASRYLSTEKPEVTEAAAAGDAGAAGSEAATGSAGVSSSSEVTEIALNPDWKYAGFAKITSGKALLYRSQVSDRKNLTVCVNAGHGTKGGSSVKTQCHPDGTPKVTGGTTSAGATSAVAVSGGMQFADGTAESKVTLSMAKILKEKLLVRGYDVLMIRESDDVQLDNIARTVIANQKADCHIALHWDSTEKDKGAFYMSVPDVASYRSMEPVASNWQKHHALGDSLIQGLQGAGVKIFSNGTMAMDLTQTSYSTIPSVDIELGDKTSDHSQAALERLATGLADGVDRFFR